MIPPLIISGSVFGLQISHHPPVTAFYVTNRQDGFSVSGSVLAKSKFYGAYHQQCSILKQCKYLWVWCGCSWLFEKINIPSLEWNCYVLGLQWIDEKHICIQIILYCLIHSYWKTNLRTFSLDVFVVMRLYQHLIPTVYSHKMHIYANTTKCLLHKKENTVPLVFMYQTYRHNSFHIRLHY